jgi:ribosomal protein S18 acetylase RimI-like enzyme
MENIGSFQGKTNGLTYILLKSTENNRFEAFRKGQPDESIGFYKLNEASIFREILDNHNIIVPKNHTIYSSDVNVAHKDRGEGVATALMRKLIEDLKSRELIHIAFFSPMGEQFLRPKYIREDYTVLDIPRKELPRGYRKFNGWLYKVYNG